MTISYKGFGIRMIENGMWIIVGSDRPPFVSIELAKTEIDSAFAMKEAVDASQKYYGQINFNHGKETVQG